MRRALIVSGRYRLVRQNRSASRYLSSFKDDYEGHVAERAAQGIVPKPLDAGEYNLNNYNHNWFIIIISSIQHKLRSLWKC